MNYSHAYHAGNFADVVKHTALCRVLMHLREKPAAFRVIDTHAGSGRYDLDGIEAAKTGEWRNGIGRLMDATLATEPRELLTPYLDAVAALNPSGRLASYPGSPLLAQALMRRQDRLIACEREPRAAAALQRALSGDRRTKAIAIDGWTALSAYVPPTERRGVVLVDPPFEQPGEYQRIVQGLTTAHRKWPTGCYLIWYPIKEPAEVSGFIRDLARRAIAKMLRIELILASSGTDLGLRGSGLIVVNPPWTLHDELKVLMPTLARALSRDAAAGSATVDWLAGETAS